jgi:hypothetical protein
MHTHVNTHTHTRRSTIDFEDDMGVLLTAERCPRRCHTQMLNFSIAEMGAVMTAQET